MGPSKRCWMLTWTPHGIKGLWTTEEGVCKGSPLLAEMGHEQILVFLFVMLLCVAGFCDGVGESLDTLTGP